MKRQNVMLLLIIGSLLTSPLFAYVAGWAGDKHCSAEEEGLGECERHDDGLNNVYSWLSDAAYIAVFFHAIHIIIGGFVLHLRDDGLGEWIFTMPSTFVMVTQE